MADTVSISKSYLDNLQTQITRLTQVVEDLVHKLDDPEPKEGTKAWWVWSDRQADKAIKNGDVIELKDKKAINTFFDELSS